MLLTLFTAVILPILFLFYKYLRIYFIREIKILGVKMCTLKRKIKIVTEV